MRYRARCLLLLSALVAALTLTGPAEAAPHDVPAARTAAAFAHPAPSVSASPVREPSPQPADLSAAGLLRASLPGFLAGLASGTVLAVGGWIVKRLTRRRSAP
ncbi:hypothetical protein [Streptomyces cinnamoneus]|uniref:Tat pathway signal sequence domain protein n=1 Tax=Streptomyces cinnamoneus TaxID=53446 RepID=A0A918WF16_STRCJ|nr:hypothetical protein [Streptomyces cinnamoneus]GHC40858.1 hypothetical protein GCM10010507_13920 [Streptomyces cinnamoneus]